MFKKTLLSLCLGTILAFSSHASYATVSNQNIDVKNITKKAEIEDDAISQFKLGIIYKQGLADEKQDLKKAFKWFKKAAENDHGEAAAFLGMAYINGEGTKQNINKGIEWLEQAGLFGVADAYGLLGAIYEQGSFVESDLNKAMQYYKEACDMKSKDGCAHYERVAKLVKK